jgi:hypothetical protein
MEAVRSPETLVCARRCTQRCNPGIQVPSHCHKQVLLKRRLLFYWQLDCVKSNEYRKSSSCLRSGSYNFLQGIHLMNYANTVRFFVAPAGLHHGGKWHSISKWEWVAAENCVKVWPDALRIAGYAKNLWLAAGTRLSLYAPWIALRCRLNSTKRTSRSIDTGYV